MSEDGTGARGPLRLSVWVGVFFGLLCLVGGIAFALTREQAFTAETQLIVLPASTLSSANQANYYETLSRGQVVATFAEVAQDQGFEAQAATGLGLTEAQRAANTVDVTVIPSTSLLLVKVSGPDGATTEKLADLTSQNVIDYVTALGQPYDIRQVRPADGSAFRVGTSPLVLIGLAFAVALAVALALQQAVYQVLTAVRSGGRTAAPPAPVTAPPSPATAPRGQPIRDHRGDPFPRRNGSTSGNGSNGQGQRTEHPSGRAPW